MAKTSVEELEMIALEYKAIMKSSVTLELQCCVFSSNSKQLINCILNDPRVKGWEYVSLCDEHCLVD